MTSKIIFSNIYNLKLNEKNGFFTILSDFCKFEVSIKAVKIQFFCEI